MKPLLYCLCLCLFLDSVSQLAVAKDKIILWKRNYEKAAIHEVIELAARLSEDQYGPYEIVQSIDIVQGRAFAALPEGEMVNVIVAAISSEREQVGLPIYVPLDRGLLGFRVCLQNSEGQPIEGIKDAQDLNLQQVLIGVGSHWPDRDILETNGLRVAHSPVYEQLFSMLDKGRFQCFLRSMHEVDGELSRFQDLQLKIEPNIAIVYPQADFAFVSIKHPRIRARLALGLQKAIETGAFNEHFEKHYADTLKRHQLYDRKLILLENPDLSLEAVDAINQYGVASFAPQHVQKTQH